MLSEKRQLYRSEAEVLRQAASDGFVPLQMAHLKNEHALEIVEEGALSDEGTVAIRQQGHEYTQKP